LFFCFTQILGVSVSRARFHLWENESCRLQARYIAATLDDIRRTRKPLSTRHRIITVQGATATSSSSVNGCTTTTPAK
jgi:hypothetical protein